MSCKYKNTVINLMKLKVIFDCFGLKLCHNPVLKEKKCVALKKIIILFLNYSLFKNIQNMYAKWQSASCRMASRQ